jgi:hypothetical protein
MFYVLPSLLVSYDLSLIHPSITACLPAFSDTTWRLTILPPIPPSIINPHNTLITYYYNTGKWMELGFDAQGHITGSKITSYLLEKSRVTKVGKGERSYHIFYQLLRGDVEFLKDKSTSGYVLYSTCSPCFLSFLVCGVSVYYVSSLSTSTCLPACLL